MNSSKHCKNLENKLVSEFLDNIKAGVFAFTQVNFAYNSNKIEGGMLSQQQAQSLFDAGTIFGNSEIIKAKDIEEMHGHFLMFNEMLKTYLEPLNHELIKKYHFQLKSGVFEDQLNGYIAGEYKTRANIVSNIQTVKPQDVFDCIDELLNEYNSKQTVTIEDIAIFHAKFEKIHPFQDGNGRVGRIIIFKECLKNGLIPLIINDSDKLTYYSAINCAQLNNDYTELIELFVKSQSTYYKKLIDFYSR